jgi:hypothetical protein
VKPSLSLLLLVLCCSTAAADVVYLKGGGKVTGRIVKRTDSALQVEVGAGTIGVPTSSVDRIVEGRSPLDEYAERASALQPGDRSGWTELGRWASDQGLTRQSREAYNRVLAIDPSDPEANNAMGRAQVNGQWMTEDEANQANGFVKLDGEWMTPNEAQAIARQRAAEDDAERAQAAAHARVAEAEQRAHEAEERARAAQAQADVQPGIPLYWGWGWGPGPMSWPAGDASNPSGLHP